MILIAVPVLNRPWRAAQLVEVAHEATTVDHRILFLCTPGDEAQIAACIATGEDTLIVEWERSTGDYARKINHAVSVSQEPWILQAADDLCFCPGWAENALRCASGARASVIGTNDLGNPRVMSGEHSTHSLVSRSYIMEQGTIDEPGKMLHEGYDHCFCDDEMVATARIRRVFVFCAQSELPHLHPNWGKAGWDATYDKSLAGFEHDRALYNERKQLWLGR